MSNHPKQGAAPLAGSAFGLAPFSLAPQGAAPTVFEVHNAWIFAHYVPPQLQRLIDIETSFVTATGEALKTGWKPPEAATGDRYWDGTVRLSEWRTGGQGRIPTGLLSRVIAIANRFGFPFVIEERRVRPTEGVPDIPPLAQLFPFQKAASEAAYKVGTGVLDMPPRAGKTLTMIDVVRAIALPAVWICPATNIVDQTIAAFDAALGPNYAGTVASQGTWQESTHLRCIVITTAMARLLPRAFFETREVLVVDEVHHAACETLRHDVNAKCEHIYFRFGMTGTFFRSGNDTIALHAMLSSVVYKITTRELIDLGRLVPTHVVFMPMECPKVRVKAGLSFQKGTGLAGLTAHQHRNQLAAWAALVTHSRGLKVLVLVATKAQGRVIESLITAQLPRSSSTEFQPTEFVSTDRQKHVVKKILRAFVTSNEVQILIGTSMVGEGTDLPTCDALIYARGGEAEVGLVQAAFRVSTAASQKRHAFFVDFSDDHHKTLLAHAKERARIFWNEPLFTTTVLAQARFLPDWLDSVSGK